MKTPTAGEHLEGFALALARRIRLAERINLIDEQEREALARKALTPFLELKKVVGQVDELFGSLDKK